ncbi:hypothetical protein ACTOB_003863 [Actinoplanes oblitus]|uniref:Uncharacterized protein n=1 Tax=Actinoplanes oblitus TaxID=3040509 RepID=A0ABY8WU24_9ACTN|nr:hypothetical protein [Actinoplanes oblitus]WIN00169.1 hypothetical protein ACTOB_003863 [Actinoplanes oblitus]
MCLAANDIRMLADHADEIRGAIDRDLSRLRDELPGGRSSSSPTMTWSISRSVAH